MTGPQGETVASSPLLRTKFYVPRWRPGSVARPRLLQRLDRGAAAKLTLISAPAGFGKTTVLAEWLGTATVERSVAWLSLDAGDNHPSTFWTYLATALQSVQPEVGGTTLAQLQSPQAPATEVLLGGLLNELVALRQDVLIVLDDYHLIEIREIHEGIEFLLDHLPPNVHVVIAGRADPPLPLARLRGRGDLVEVRAADLRFTADEAATFLSETMGLDVSAGDIAALDARAEGWIAGLQLAALSMQGRKDLAGFINAFTGDDRYIVDYLVEEVLARQTDEVRAFLLETSILDRLGGALCEAVTGAEDGRATLEMLERQNLFVVPLDDRRQWYRYHHLFTDVLQAHLRAERAEHIPLLHRRASGWFERQAEFPHAIRHAFAGEDFEHAASLVERALPAMLGQRQDAVLRGWLRALPEDLLRRRPVLSVGYATTLMRFGELDAVEPLLSDAERRLALAVHLDRAIDPSAGPVFVDEEQFRTLPGMIAVYRAGVAQLRGDLGETIRHARLALDLVAEDDHLGRGAATSLLGLALWSSGDLEEAHRTFSSGIAHVRRAGHISEVIASALGFAQMRAGQGRLRDAAETYEQALQLASAQSGPAPAGTADLHVGMSEICLERNDIEGAARHLAMSGALGESAALIEHRFRRYVAMADIRVAEGDVPAALALLHEAERLHAEGFFPDLRPIAALRARLWLAQGRLADAVIWAEQRNLSASDEARYRLEFEHLTLARVLIARYQREGDAQFLHEAEGLLGRLLQAAEEMGRHGSIIEILRLQAMARGAVRDVAGALVLLERALILAEPEGYVRSFVLDGEAMRDLLRHAAAAGVRSGYARQLLGAFPEATPRPPVSGSAPGLAEPLTPREVEVLRLVAAGLTNQEIADQLVVTLSTVKRHIANSYGKLGAGHRTEAIVRANALNLL